MTTIVLGTVFTTEAVGSQEALKQIYPQAWKDKVQQQNPAIQIESLMPSPVGRKMTVDSIDQPLKKMGFSKVGLSEVFELQSTPENSKIKDILLEKNSKNSISYKSTKSKIGTIPTSISVPEIISIVPEVTPVVTEVANLIAPPPEISTTQTIAPTTSTNQIQTPYEGVTVFGDSLSDNGNLHRMSNGVILPSPYFFQGRASNGFIWPEKIAPSMQLQKVDSNFAVGGENSLQIKNRIEDWAQTSITNPGQQIYSVWSGTNDYNQGISTPTLVIENIQTSIKTLKLAGAQTILVLNLPHFTAAPESTPLSQDLILQAHNKALYASLLELSKSNYKVNIIPIDIRSLSDRILTNPSRFGLTNVTEPCLTSAGICTNPDQSMWWDWIHPSAAMHTLIADYTVSVLRAPQTIAPQMTTSLDLTKRAGQDVGDRLIALRQIDSTPMGQLNIFALGSVQSGKQTDPVIGSNSSRRGFTAGADYRISRDFTAGIAFTSAQGSTILNDDRGKIVMNGSALSGYGSYRRGHFFTEGIFSYGWNQLDVTRKVQVTGFNEANSTTAGQQVAAQIKAGYNLGFNSFSIVPTIGVSYANANLSGYSERNADVLNLNVGTQSSSSLALNLGTRFAYDFRSDFGMITPYASANYSHTLTNGSREITTELVTQPGIPNRTTVNGGDRDVIRLGIGVQAKLINSLTFSVGYEKAISQNTSDQSVQGILNYAF